MTAKGGQETPKLSNHSLQAGEDKVPLRVVVGRRYLLGIAAAFFAGAAWSASLNQAADGFTYFSRPGADMAAHEAALKQCLAYAASTRLVGSFALGESLIDDAQKDHMFAANLENCMVVKGWKVVRIPDEEAAVLAQLAPPELAHRLAAKIGMDLPSGEIVREWANDAQLRATNRTGHAHILGGGTSLSLKLLPKEVVRKVAPEKTKSPKARLLMRPMRLEELGGVQANNATIIFEIRNAGMAHGVSFARLGAEPGSATWADDGGTNIIGLLNQGGTFQTPEGARLLAFSVPPGRWQMVGLSGVYSSLVFCLGAPAFDAKAGDVVFAGQFDFAGEQFGPDLNLQDAQALLSAQPALAAKLRPARYVNGTRSECNKGQNIYAFEVNGAPYVEGYAWGGALKPFEH